MGAVSVIDVVLVESVRSYKCSGLRRSLFVLASAACCCWVLNLLWFG